MQVRFLVLKNLAAVLAEEPGSAEEALRLYGDAAQLDGGDIVLWNRMGTLVRPPPIASSKGFVIQALMTGPPIVSIITRPLSYDTINLSPNSVSLSLPCR